jgi:hypothetical protein
MKTLNLNEQEMVAGGYAIYDYRSPYPFPWVPRPRYIPKPPIDIEAITRELAQSGTISGASIVGSFAGIGIAAPLTAAPWSAGTC